MQNSSSLVVRLITEENKQETENKLEDLEPNFTYQRTRTTATSFFKTVFHGLNALSGLLFNLSLVFENQASR